MTSNLAARVRSLINRVHAGSVNAAAKDIGLAQSTLAQIASGVVSNPRADALERIGAFYSATTDWLISGRGDEPGVLYDQQVTPIAERLRWNAVIGRIGLSDSAAWALWVQPDEILALHFIDDDNISRRMKEERARSLFELQRHSLLTWIQAVERIVDDRGVDGARAYFEKEAPRLALNSSDVRAALPRDKQATADDVWRSVERAQLQGGFSAELAAQRAGRSVPAAAKEQSAQKRGQSKKRV